MKTYLTVFHERRYLADSKGEFPVLRLFILIAAAALSLSCSQGKLYNEAKSGVLDLSSWDLNQQNRLLLENDWDFFPSNFFSSSFLNRNPSIAGEKYTLNRFFNFFSHYNTSGTFRMKLVLPEQPSEDLYIRISGWNSSYAVYADDKALFQSGRLGTSSKSSSVWMDSKIRLLGKNERELNLLICTSNFHSFLPGFWGKVEIGSLKGLEMSSTADSIYSFTMAILFFCIAVFSFARFKSVQFLILGAASLCLTILSVFSGSYVFSTILPESETLGLLISLRILPKIILASVFAVIFLELFKNRKTAVRTLGIFLYLSYFGLIVFFDAVTALSAGKLLLPIFLIPLTAALFEFYRRTKTPVWVETYVDSSRIELEKARAELIEYKKNIESKIIDRSYNMVSYMEKLEIQTNEIEKLNELVVNLLAGSNMNEMLHLIFSHIINFYKAEIAFLYFLDTDKNELFPYRGMTKDIPEEIAHYMNTSRIPLSREAGVSYIVYKRRKTVYLKNSKTKYVKKREHSADGFHPELISTLYIPIIIRGDFHGIFFLATFNKELNLNKNKLKFISMFTSQLAAAIEKEQILTQMEKEKKKALAQKERAVKARKETEEAKRETEAVNELAKSINENMELKNIMKKIMNFVGKNYGIRYYSLYILNYNKNKLKMLEALFPDLTDEETREKIMQTAIPINAETGAYSYICRMSKMVYFKKMNAEKSCDEEKLAVENLNISSMVGIPLKLKNETIGILSFFSPEEMKLNRNQLRTLASLGEQAAGVIHNSNLYKQVQEEKEKSDRLLLNILPPKIAEELKNTGKVVPVVYDSSTILFTDFVGFTKIAETLLPKQLLIELDGFFTFFDFICEKYNLEKLKTIGDAYMCVGGLPTANLTHPVDACLAALEFREFAERMKELVISSKEKMMPWELRIGLHTGPVIGGAVGTTKFAYDVWGDSVNTASRIEASCLPGKVNISGTTYDLIKDFFECEYRGKVKAKNKGQIDMYFVKGIRTELTRDGDGITPNEKFQLRYELLKTNKLPTEEQIRHEHINGHKTSLSDSIAPVSG